jgi:hypothetical protein
MTNFAKIAWKWTKSWQKPPGTWTTEDYPIHVRKNGWDPSWGEEASSYVATVLNWPGPAGIAETREAAIADLHQSIDQIEERPRPGTKVSLHFAESSKLDAFGPWAYEFLEEITGGVPYFISDGSNLRDFAIGDEDLYKSYIDLVYHRYGVDVSDIEHGDLIQILTRLAAAGHGPKTQT